LVRIGREHSAVEERSGVRNEEMRRRNKINKNTHN
jgi:hypothetical protein